MLAVWQPQETCNPRNSCQLVWSSGDSTPLFVQQFCLAHPHWPFRVGGVANSNRVRLVFSASSYNSNKSPTRCNSLPVYYPDVYSQLNMFRTFSRPSSGAQRLQWQPQVLPSYRGDRCAVVCGRAGPTSNTARLSPRYEGKSRDCHCSRAPDNGRGKRPKHVEL
jgi:hypothetical protein